MHIVILLCERDRDMAAIPAREQCAYQSCYCEENVYKLVEQLVARGVPADRLYAVFISNAAKKIPLWMQRSGDAFMDGLVQWDYHVILIQLPHAAPPNLPDIVTQVPQHNEQGRLSLDTICSASNAWVWDLDTQLPFPCSAEQYVQRALRTELVLEIHQQEQMAGTGRSIRPSRASDILRYYRVVSASLYLSNFASDRRHMLLRVPAHAQDGHSSNDGSHEGNQHAAVAATGTAAAAAGAPAGFRWYAPPPPWPLITSQATGHTHNLPRYWDVGPHNCARTACQQSGGSAGNMAGAEHEISSEAWLGKVYDEERFASLLLGPVYQPADRQHAVLVAANAIG